MDIGHAHIFVYRLAHIVDCQCRDAYRREGFHFHSGDGGNAGGGADLDTIT